MTPDRKIAPKIHDAIDFDFHLPDIHTEELDNGLKLYWLNAGVQDVVEIDWVFPAGLWYEDKTSVAHACSGLLKNGTSGRTAHEIHEALEFYGATLKANTGNDYGTLSLFTLTRHLPALLPIIYEIITDAIFPEKELQIHKQNAIQRLLVNQRQCEYVANHEIDGLIFGKAHPYGRYALKENIEAVTREDMITFYRHSYALANVKMFMAGKTGSTEVKLVNEIFGKDPVRSVTLPDKNFEYAGAIEKKHNILNDPNGVQGAIRIGGEFPGRLHPDFAPMVVLNTLFGGYFGARLMSNIREDKGYTYGIYSSLSPFLHGGSFIIHTEVGRDVIEPAIKEIYHEMQVLRDTPANEEELLLVKNYLLGNLLGDLDGPFSILQRWRTIILYHLTKEHFENNIRTYKTVTAEKLQELALKYFNPAGHYELVVI